MFEVVDKVASQLLAGRFPGTRGALARVAATTTSSLPAAKAYFSAEQQMGNGRFSTASDLLRGAVRLDSTFAFAYYRMSHAAELVGDANGAREAAALAVRYSNKLDDQYRKVVAAAAARQEGDIAGAERAYSRLTIDYPQDAEALFGLAESQFHLNAYRGQSPAAAREAFMRVVELDSRHVEALVHLARIEALRADSAGVDKWLRQARELTNDDLIGRLALHVRSLGGASSAGGVDRQRLQRASTLHRGPSTRDILTAIEPRAMDRYAAQFLSPDVPSDLAAYGHRLAAYSACGMGQFKSAMSHLDQAQEADVDSDIEARSLIVAIPGSPFDSATIAHVRMTVDQWQPSDLHDPDQSLDAIAHSRAHALLRLHRLGLLAIRAGDTVAASRAADRLLKITEPDSETIPTANALSLSLKARIAAYAGDSARALAIIDRVQWARAGRVAASEPLDRLLHADLLAAAGRYQEAINWYSTLGTGAPQELPFTGFAMLGMARASERLGDKPGAVRYYQRVAAIWSSADAPLQAVANSAGRRLATLEAGGR
jgi:hypothetical protein